MDTHISAIFLYLMIKTYSRAMSCSFTIPNGVINWEECMVYTHPLDCQYYCYFGYKQHPNVSRVSCSSSGTWISTWPEPIVTADELCIYFRAISCNSFIPHGHLKWKECRERTTASECPYYCDSGYEKHPRVSRVSCSSSGTWTSTWPELIVTADELCIHKICPGIIPNGELSAPCRGKVPVGSTCGYICQLGYQPKFGVSSIDCEKSRKWSVNPHSLCTKSQQCLYEIENGDLDLSCNRGGGETCTYTCHLGYLPSSTNATCSSSYSWDKRLSSFCTEVRCPDTITNGYISSRCSRRYGRYCNSYSCKTGYSDNPRLYLRCNAFGQWEWERSKAKILCPREEDLCPSTFINGKISRHCSRQPGDLCSYSCNPDCTKSSIARLRCRDNKTWDHSTALLCKKITILQCLGIVGPIVCLTTIRFGWITNSCRNKSYLSECTFKCRKHYSAMYPSLICGANGRWDHQDSACSYIGRAVYDKTTLYVVLAILPTAIISVVIFAICAKRRKHCLNKLRRICRCTIFQTRPIVRANTTSQFSESRVRYSCSQHPANSNTMNAATTEIASQDSLGPVYTATTETTEIPHELPPSYEETTEPPPSYEEATAHPAYFNLSAT